jgi:hypothetical protein
MRRLGEIEIELYWEERNVYWEVRMAFKSERME